MNFINSFAYDIKRSVLPMSKTSDRYKVNFSNPKTMQVIHYLQLAENRLSREEMMSIGNRDILYKLKNSGYIKETSKGSFQGTKKLRTEMAKRTGCQFGKGSSSQHAQKLLSVAKCIPKEIISGRDFKTGTELEKQFNQYKTTEEYKERTEQARQEQISRIESLNQYHANVQSSPSISEREKLQENINYLQSYSVLERNLSIIEEERYSVPDFSFTCSREQSLEFLNNLNKTQSNTGSGTYSLIDHNGASANMKQTIEETATDTITWTIEIVTSNYGTEDLERHYLYDRVTSTHTIYI